MSVDLKMFQNNIGHGQSFLGFNFVDSKSISKMFGIRVQSSGFLGEKNKLTCLLIRESRVWPHHEKSSSLKRYFATLKKKKIYTIINSIHTSPFQKVYIVDSCCYFVFTFLCKVKSLTTGGVGSNCLEYQLCIWGNNPPYNSLT